MRNLQEQRPPAGISAPAPRASRSLLQHAKTLWAESALEIIPAERYRLAHLAALRGAAAVLSARPPAPSRGRPVSAWHLLDVVAPELSDWSAYFRDSATIRAAIEGGARAGVSDRVADDLVTAVSEFLAITGRLIGISSVSAAPTTGWPGQTTLAS